MKIMKSITTSVSALAVSALPAVAWASTSSGGAATNFWDRLIALLFGSSRGSGSGSSGSGSDSAGVPELGAEGVVAAAVILLAVVAIVMDRRRRATHVQG
jgi:hypothetical protein